MMRLPVAFVVPILLLPMAACSPPVPATPPVGATGTAAAAGPRSVISLHGKIVETDGRTAVSPEHGPYEFDAIVEALRDDSTTVIAPLRAAGAGVVAHADSTAQRIRQLMAEGVKPERITVVGASKGGVIALVTSTRLDEPAVGYVVLGACYADLEKDFQPRLHGRVLSIYEASDSGAQSCKAAFAASPGIAGHSEIRLETGLGHGFLFRPMREWVEPARGWVRRN